MNVIIEYLNKTTIKNNNIVIFVSKLSELKSLNFHFNLQNLQNNKDFVNRIEEHKYIEFTTQNSKNLNLLKIKIYLINTKEKNFISLGASIFDQCNFKIEKDISFIFSNFLIQKKINICADVVFGFKLKSYKFNKYLTNKKNLNQSIKIYLFNSKLMKNLTYNLNLCDSINFCKNLISEPANILNPKTYAEKCNNLKKIGLKIKIFDKNKIEKLKMNALLGVSQGSVNEPRVVVLEWNIKPNSKPSIIVGKGVTFDTGGISIKPSSGMEEMIIDMGGSAVVVASMMNAALNKSKHSLVGIVGLVENMPDGKAQRPGDIVKSLSGQTIEVLNTDAEGRLVLGDIITYVQNRYKPKQIIDFATLTGAIMIALGNHRAGLFSNNDKLSQKLENAGELTGEKLWRLPLGNEYDREINSLRADIKNIGSTRFGGSIHAAQFIKRFIKKDIPWAHLDIAGVTWLSGGQKNTFSNFHSPGATAFGVRLIDQFLKGK